jgi:hypothetical protein
MKNIIKKQSGSKTNQRLLKNIKKNPHTKTPSVYQSLVEATTDSIYMVVLAAIFMLTLDIAHA